MSKKHPSVKEVVQKLRTIVRRAYIYKYFYTIRRNKKQHRAAFRQLLVHLEEILLLEEQNIYSTRYKVVCDALHYIRSIQINLDFREENPKRKWKPYG